MLLGSSVEVFAQIRLSGVVTDDQQIPLPAVSVFVKETGIGSVTDTNGKYQITAKPGQTLVFSYIGFTTVKRKITSTKVIYNVMLSMDKNYLDDVVVVGYGTQKKVNLTGSVSSVSADKLENRPILSSSTALQGVAAGVTVTTKSGAPGGDGGTIRIRGIGTFGNSSASPLVLIDGVQGSMNDVDASQIDKISVLKDAASSAIYGSRAANGVILITTKRGKEGQTFITYRGYAGVQEPTKLPDLVSAEDYMILNRETSENDGIVSIYDDDYINNYKQNHILDPDKYPITDWQKRILKGSGFLHNHNVTMSASSKRVKVLTSLSYLLQDGIIKNTDFERYNVRNNMNIKLSDKLTMKFDQSATYSIRKSLPNQSTIFKFMNTCDPLYLAEYSTGYYAGTPGANFNVLPYLDGDGGNSKTKSMKLNGLMSLNYKPFDWLSLEGMIAPRFIMHDWHSFKDIVTLSSDPFGSPGLKNRSFNELDESNSQTYYGNYQFLTTFHKKIAKKHDFKLLLGLSHETMHYKILGAHRQDFAYPEYEVISGGAYDETMRNNGTKSEWALQSYFARFNYNYRERYLFEANVRYDGSSRFAKGNRWGLFPSFSVAWRITEEPFMKNLTDVLNEFKIRTSYGQLGNQMIGSNYPTYQNLSIGSISTGTQILPIVSLNSLANEDITWESSEMYDIGVDFTLFDKISFTADWYYKNTNDILMKLDIPKTIGLGAPYQNAGKVRNQGWEVSIGYHDNLGEFSYGIDANFSDVHNEIVDIKGRRTTRNDGMIVYQEGSPLNSIWGFKCRGMARTQEQADYINKTCPQFGGEILPGNLVYEDINSDGKIDDDDKTIIGCAIPRHTFGFTLSCGWKGFNMSAFFQGVGKADGLLSGYYVMPNAKGGTYRKEHLDRWTTANPQEGLYPRMSTMTENDQKISSFWVRNAGYLRLKNIQMSYNLPKNFVSKIGLSSVMLFANAQNVYTYTNFYQGYDPEVCYSGTDGVSVGSANNYPQVMTFTGGLEIKF